MESKTSSKRIPCLDGLRAVAISFVLLQHGREGSYFSGFPRLAWIPFSGITGVALFFIISGYLITTLLLRERDRTGTVSLRHFYIRRALRIFPAFYTFLAVVLLLRALHVVQVPFRQFLYSATYLYTFYHGPQAWIVGHTWSLSIEEQFYILWPLAVTRLKERTALAVAVLVAVGWPLLRVVAHHGVADPRVMLSTAGLDVILYGSILALLAHSEKYGPALRRLASGAQGFFIPAAGLWLLYSFAASCPRELAAFIPMVNGVLLCYLLWWAVCNPTHPVGRFLEWRPVAAVGLLSYSLYLWQQPFLGEYRWEVCRFPVNLLATFLAAALSYYLVEQPLNRLKQSFAR